MTTQFIMLYGAKVTVKVMDAHHHRSPLVQGGLEIPIQVAVTMEYSTQNNDTMDEPMVTDRPEPIILE